MKRILLLFLALSCSVISYSQTETNKESAIIYVLEAVELIALKQKKTICYSKSTCSRTIIGCGFLCRAKGIPIENVSDQKEIDTKLFPNPSANGIFQINFKEKYNKIKVVVNSISGQAIQSKVFQNVLNKVTIDLSQYPSGIFLINIIADGKQLPTKKAIRG
ncbi:T9SS type A sorting domain-containing protein [Lacinutrix sp. Bg11-31]|uniref:T9SS type A sorting domain-containing protein n=1 Tax=Lacinutrix sp. Bg11-31 TaxID=2057808 RepID=UPI000C31A07B|nr:T9SS type A sorting domain-containing protein [Lacinutrix sp. Bg11-31]AUC83533.1 hypothetical protein CW733_15915 [Lacinutrix sp. Bg11-31]